MKIKSFFLLLLTTLLLLVSCSSGDTTVPQGMKLASTDKNDFTAYVPMNWEVDMSTGTLTAKVLEDDTNIAITGFALTSKQATMKVEDYWKVYEKDFAETFGDIEYDGEVISMQLDGMPAVQATYSATVTGARYKFMQTVCINNAKVYIITYTTHEENFDKYIEDADKVIENFKFN